MNIRLVHFDIPAVVNAFRRENRAPALLVSYYYLEPFLKNQSKYRYRDWVMDSGAFSAENSGKKIDLQKYIDTCLQLMEQDQTLTEIFALDVIGDAEASNRNCEEMWRQGVPAIPCFHQNEPEEFLLHYAKEYPKIALGGVALERGDFKLAWLEQCFARVWPKKIHGFGMSSEKIIYSLPFHSVDATNWEIAPCAFGNWQKFGKMSVRGSEQDLRSQVYHYLDMEAKARVRWKKEMTILDKLPPVPRAAQLARQPLRLAVANTNKGVYQKEGGKYQTAFALATSRTAGPLDANAGRQDAKDLALGPASTTSAPTVRLAVDAGAAGGRHAETAFKKPDIAPAATAPPPKKQKTSADLDPANFKYADYWSTRGFSRDPSLNKPPP